MHTQWKRREFLAVSAAAGASLMTRGRLEAAPLKTHLKKALIGKPTIETLESWKAAGFDGIESNDRAVSLDAAAETRKKAEKMGMRVHSMLYGWANFNSKDAGKVASDIEGVAHALRATEAYGGTALLLVPCRIGGMAMPQPWDFEIEFDPKTGHVEKVVPGDNVPYAAYIEAQNHATDASRRAIRKLIPVAEKAGVAIAVENVWNNLWVKPDIFKNFVASFDSPWVQAYFDIGNHVKYAMPEEWIRTLGKLIAKVHVKDFKVDRKAGRGGKFVNIREGDVDWPLVRQELDKIGYNGWMTIEGSGGLSLDEKSKRLDLIIAGK